MRICDWSSDVCSSDLLHGTGLKWLRSARDRQARGRLSRPAISVLRMTEARNGAGGERHTAQVPFPHHGFTAPDRSIQPGNPVAPCRSEEHTSELQSLMRISDDVFCLK